MERRAIEVRGIVQGVGFRPFVHGLASGLGLAGFVKNETGTVQIEVEGEAAALDRFLDELQNRPPPLSRIDAVTWRQTPAIGERGFCIESSTRLENGAAGASSEIFIAPDAATCADCVAELLDPADRRYRYPFLNCTNCGPRLTIVRGAPYDRERTTMAGFPMCADCRAEYDDPHDRRFHAQPIACPKCGPHLEVRTPQGELIETDDPLAHFAGRLKAGEIGALKGLGGFHLVCDARNELAVRELRRRKHRDEKPFAVMVRDVEAALQFVEVDRDEHALLESPRCPIVLLRKRRGAGDVGAEMRADDGTVCADRAVSSDTVAEAVAPCENPSLGLMLPYTPLHHLLLQAMDGAPLVMTSGNRSDEPIAYENDDALSRLGEIADVFLLHNRPIHVRCDDSVTRIVASAELPLRRSRGYAPQPVGLPLECPCQVLAVGGDLKNVFALGRGRQALLCHHLGDLKHFAAYQAMERDVRLYEQLFDIAPELIVHDLHPDYASTGYAQRRAAEEGLPRLAVQHHHAHMASCMAEHGLDEPVIGVSFDGTGFGTDGAIWGGEFLVGDYGHFRRAAHLRYVPMPGGEQAIRQPWRMARSQLRDAGCDPASSAGGVSPVSPEELRAVDTLLERGFNSPPTSSAGRLFDAVAAIAGVRQQVSFEGQAAMELEWLATGVAEDGSYPFEYRPAENYAVVHYPVEHRAAEHQRAENQPVEAGGEIDTRPLIRAVVRDAIRGASAAQIARRFHTTVVEIIAAVCDRIRVESGLDAVVLSGGVFLNALLTRETCDRLQAAGFRVFRHRLVPPGDGGLCLGQLAIAARPTENRGPNA